MVDVLVMFLEQFVLFPSGVVHCPKVVKAGLGFGGRPEEVVELFLFVEGRVGAKSALLLFIPSMTVVHQ